jgi:hypothetical protein
VKARAEQLVSEWDSSDYTVFTTTGQRSRVRPDYFMESAEKISCFMEDSEEAMEKF